MEQIKKYWKIVIAVAVIIVALFWAVDSTRSRSYNGSGLNVVLGGGLVTVTNTSDEAVPVHLAGTGSRSFTVASTIEGVAGSSAREGSGSSAAQVFDFTLPPGISEFTVTRGENVNFTASGDTTLAVTALPSSADEQRTTMIIAGVVILAALFFISRATGHSWINTILRREAPVPYLVPVAEAAVDPNRGTDGRMYSNYGREDK